mmetsp:Transcript_15536/g.21831  ORF Transcript_15536/g.21831 Transcript_15536/m.21831 type:complete len:217 (+) Transcript_15536:164-814(+)
MTNQTLDRPGSSIPKSTDSVALNLTGQLIQHIDLSEIGVTFLHAGHNVVEPSGAFTARSALSARLVLVEGRQTANSSNHVGTLVENSDSSSAQTTLHSFQCVKIHENIVADVLREHGDRRPARNDGFEVVPTTINIFAVHLNQILQRNAHFFFYCDGVVNVARNTEEFGTSVKRASKRVEPGSAAAEDGGSHSDGLNISYSGRAAVQTDIGRKRGL